MPVDSAKVRSVVVVGHAASGKTSLVDAMLFFAKAVPVRGKVANGTSVADNLPEEIERKITIHAKPFFFQHSGFGMTLLDTPGFPDFLGETAGSCR